MYYYFSVLIDLIYYEKHWFLVSYLVMSLSSFSTKYQGNTDLMSLDVCPLLFFWEEFVKSW